MSLFVQLLLPPRSGVCNWGLSNASETSVAFSDAMQVYLKTLCKKMALGAFIMDYKR